MNVAAARKRASFGAIRNVPCVRQPGPHRMWISVFAIAAAAGLSVATLSCSQPARPERPIKTARGPFGAAKERPRSNTESGWHATKDDNDGPRRERTCAGANRTGQAARQRPISAASRSADEGVIRDVRSCRTSGAGNQAGTSDPSGGGVRRRRRDQQAHRTAEELTGARVRCRHRLKRRRAISQASSPGKQARQTSGLTA